MQQQRVTGIRPDYEGRPKTIDQTAELVTNLGARRVPRTDLDPVPLANLTGAPDSGPPSILSDDDGQELSP